MCEILMTFVKMILSWLKRGILAFICGVEGHDDVIIEKCGAKNRKRTFMVSDIRCKCRCQKCGRVEIGVVEKRVGYAK
jgi:hypothetical protein